jgi:hypothetical protein
VSAHSVAQRKLWSTYYSAHTLKFLVVSLPGGGIVWMSRAFAGTATDSAIVAESAVLDWLQGQLAYGLDEVALDKVRLSVLCLSALPHRAAGLQGGGAVLDAGHRLPPAEVQSTGDNASAEIRCPR